MKKHIEAFKVNLLSSLNPERKKGEKREKYVIPKPQQFQNQKSE
jgi:hypothetical protein